MTYRFADLVDIDAFRSMLQSFYEATGILHGLVDDQNNIVSAIGWQEACTVFHRANPQTNARCLESNCYLTEHLSAEGYVGRKCRNGLVDYATAVVVEGRQVATLFFGQILHEPPDLAFFRRQAQEFGFDEEAYLAAICKVPVVPPERIGPIMGFYSQLARMLASAGLDRIRQREAEKCLAELNADLLQRVDERTAELAARNQELDASRRHLQAVLDSSTVGIGWSHAGKMEYVNRKFTEMFGYTLVDVPTIEEWHRRAYPDEYFRTEIVDNWLKGAEAARANGIEASSLETPVVCKDGSVRYVIVSVSWIGERRLVNFSDITERWLAEQRDQMRNSVLEMIAKGAPLAQTLTTLVNGLEAENREMLCSILLLDEDGKHLRSGVAPSLPDFYNAAVDGLEIGPEVGSCGTAAYTRQRVIVADIQTHPCWAKYTELARQAGIGACWSEPILSSKGRILGTFAIYHRQPCTPGEGDLRLIARAANLASIAIERHQIQSELERQASTDFLTGLASRRYFIDEAVGALARAKRYGEPFSLLMIDIDRFKSINDRHGHSSGDLVLQKVAEILQANVREVDLVSRIGGEEFAVMLPKTALDNACQAAERLRLAVEGAQIFSGAGEPVAATLSVGVATVADGRADIDALLKQADSALYAAKNSGRNRVCVAETGA